MQQRALQQRQPQQTPPPASPGLGTTNPTAPPSGSTVLPAPHPDGNTYGVPTSSDGKWLYSGGKWIENGTVRTFQDGGLASLIPPPLQNGPQFGMDQLSRFVGYPQQ
jgi:hypothetical protein